MSFCLIDRPPPKRRFLTLVIKTPWRRKLALTIASPPARISPRTTLPFLSLPSHSKTISLMFFALAAMVAMLPPRCLNLVQEIVTRCESLVRDRDHFFKRGDASTNLEQS